MTTLRTLVLSDDEIDHVQTEYMRNYIGTPRGFARMIEQAVLERAGADAVRDSALEEAVRDLEKRRALLRGQYESVNIMEADAMYGLCIEAIRALKGTPAAAVADGEATAILHWIMKQADAAKEPCGDDPESNAAVRNSKLAAIAGAAAQALGMVRGPSFAAPQAGQLSGNAGEVEPRPLMVTRTSENSVMLGFRSCREASVYERAAIAASKGAKP